MNKNKSAQYLVTISGVTFLWEQQKNIFDPRQHKITRWILAFGFLACSYLSVPLKQYADTCWFGFVKSVYGVTCFGKICWRTNVLFGYEVTDRKQMIT